MNFFDEHLRDTPVMAILRGHGVEGTVELCRRAWDLGLALVEVPVQNEADLAALRAAIDEARTRGRLAGAGTVTSVDIVRRVADAGAAFTVAPGLDAEVLRASEEAGMPHLPGVATATEIQAATAHGATWLKAFPASELGAGWFTAMRDPFPRVHLVGTGGMTVANAHSFLGAGAAAVSLGSSFAGADPSAVRRLLRARPS